MKSIYDNVKESMQLIEANDKDALDAVMWMHGFNKKEAKKFIKETDNNTIQEIIKGFKENAKRNFNESKTITNVIPKVDVLKKMKGGDKIFVSDDPTDSYTKIPSGIHKGMFKSHLYFGDIYSADALAAQMDGGVCTIIENPNKSIENPNKSVREQVLELNKYGDIILEKLLDWLPTNVVKEFLDYAKDFTEEDW